MTNSPIIDTIIAVLLVLFAALLLTSKIKLTFKSKSAPIVPTKWQAETHRKLRASLQEYIECDDVSDGFRARAEALNNASLAEILEDPDAYLEAIQVLQCDSASEEDESLSEASEYATALLDSTDWGVGGSGEHTTQH